MNDDQIELFDEQPPHIDSMKEKLIKLVVVTAVGYIATQTTENLVEKVLAKRRSR